jgi:hypothetical protein
MRAQLVLVGVRAAAVVIVLAAMIAQVIEIADGGSFDATRFFAFFTIQSNLVGVAAFILVLAVRGAPRSRALELLRGASAVYLTITFVVVITLLSGVDVQLQLPWVDFVLHKLFPIIVVADWILDPPGTRLEIRDALIWLVYPLVWVGVTMLRGAADGWYPYPFLNPDNGGYGQVAITIVAVTVGFALFAAVIMWLANRRLATRPA